MVQNQVVARFKNGDILSGRTNNFFPNKSSFHLVKQNGEIADIAIKELKAVFFVKDPKGDKDYVKKYEDAIAGAGRKVKVTFADGEQIIGYTQGYTPDRQGFFMVPADLKDNNSRIYVVTASTDKIEF